MNSRLNLFSQASRRIARHRATTSRKLYTDQIYPYPFHYINTKVWPSQMLYRETWVEPKWCAFERKAGLMMARFMWTYLWYMTFTDPGAFIGHWSYPNPSIWTDEELGIPPDDVGTYSDWLAKKFEAD